MIPFMKTDAQMYGLYIKKTCQIPVLLPAPDNFNHLIATLGCLKSPLLVTAPGTVNSDSADRRSQLKRRRMFPYQRCLTFDHLDTVTG
jgi:hypothetical protein